ncbi:ABC transporter permease [Conexibacter woesei]|uniref:Binding-protein-dependent transport systems inner membrane component n=1 Tax=Conexibacter woesei (strain DSM 14684 / CCUG 47730 / CIP 108061 / JCM 11494 / NBRC 100937 / ID131577) TaxID=469383 RepID=D3F309_CONWI|nr:ABC transporter permease [Conexibacter woesei]ADB54290.1 binding-protein-dependent transport systems inner membrane component [Conexibacter woesei DSM 14684]
MSLGAPGLLQDPRAELGGTFVERSPRQLFWRRLRRDRVAMAALVVVVLLVLVALFAPLVVKLAGAPGPNVRDSGALDEFGAPAGPSAEHLFGVDDFGRDVFSRTVYGARVSLFVGIVGTAIAVALGVALGLVAGWFSGWVDTLLSGLVDVMLAFPVLLLGLGIASACSFGDGCAGGVIEPGLRTVMLVIVVVGWTMTARLVRGQVLSLREREFVDAARAMGASDRYILLREILPNLVVPIIVYSSLMVPQTILFEAALSFLGVGVSPSTPSWGSMIADAAPNFDTQWWYMVFPGAALLVTVLAFNLLGDGLQDALDPKTSQ